MDVLLILLLSGVAPGLGLGDEGHAEDGQLLRPDRIAVKYTDPGRVAYLEHVGPYWMVGPFFNRLGQYMLDHGQTGPIFVRYLDNPAEVPAKALRGEIGFFVEGDLQPDPPFEVALREPELVAFLVADGRYVQTRRYYSVVYTWIEANGHRAVGPITEIYLDPFAARTEPGTQRTEIQIALVRPKSTEPRALARAEPTESRTSARAKSPEPRTSPRDGARKGSRASIASPEPLALARAEHELTINDLIGAARFDQVAEWLMPVDQAIPQGLQVWFGQVIFRIGAAAKGIKQVYPGEHEGLMGLADALIRRYRVVSADFKLDPLDQVVMRVDPRADPLAGGKQAIMRELDGLLGRIALRTVEAQEAVEILTKMLVRVQDLLRTNRDSGET